MNEPIPEYLNTRIPEYPNTFPIPLSWSNAYLLTEGRRAALIDTGLRRDRETLLAALQAKGFGADEIEAVYLTHGHCDHAGNAAYFAERGAKVSAHRREAPYLALPRRTYAGNFAQVLRRPLSALAFAGGEILYPVERRAPNVLLEDGDWIDAPGGALRVVSCAGHSPGHIAFYRESDAALFSGDAVMNIIPGKRTSGLHLPLRIFSSDWAQAKRSVQTLAALHPQILLSGHGEPLRHETASRLAKWAQAVNAP